MVEGLLGSMVVMVAAGNGTTATITEVGELYTWGDNSNGALGCGDAGTGFEEIPLLVTGLVGQTVVGVCAWDDLMLAWTNSGSIYSWGFGGDGQLGHNCQESEHPSRLVEALVGKVVVGAAASSQHSVVVTREHEVHTFGLSDQGRLGHGTGTLIAFGVRQRLLVPREVKGLEPREAYKAKAQLLEITPASQDHRLSLSRQLS